MALKIILMSLLAFCASTSEAQQTPSQENNITLLISYPARETQGSGTTCQISEEIRENINNEILTIVQESFIPLIDETRFFTPECPCMSNGRRVAYLDMTNPDHNCPDGWREISSPRSCGRFNSISCDSAFFPTDGIAYSHVCGRVKAYKYGNVFAFMNTLSIKLVPLIHTMLMVLASHTAATPGNMCGHLLQPMLNRTEILQIIVPALGQTIQMPEHLHS